ncbi:MAG: glycosyltransferase [Hyphomicrobiaceae bacterium]|nr:glycosyltransferase [Hyphomicrobiaceae bacterium]
MGVASKIDRRTDMQRPADMSGSSGESHGAFRAFDGIICIGGEDWWYHNRGHFDFQIMRRLARRFPVLFVNSLGVRMPSLRDNRLFAERMTRKLKSLARGVVHVENGFWVFSPVTVPGATGQRLSSWALAPQIRLAAARAGIRRPLLWVHCPAGAALTEEIDAAAVVMQRTDRFEAFPEADSTVVARQIAHLKQRADLVVYAAPQLMRDEQSQVRRQVLVTHGLDVERFVAAGKAADARDGRADPADIAHLPRPRVGFIGGIDAHTFDPPLFLEVARRLADVSFVMVGGTSLPEGWCSLPNVTFLGRKPYDEVAAYMAAVDCLVMPWNESEWIRACNPVKLKEYLAAGRPVVTTDFGALDGWRDLVTVAKGADAFAAAIRSSLAKPHDPAPQRARIAGESWDGKAELLVRAFEDIGLMWAARREPATRAA